MADPWCFALCCLVLPLLAACLPPPPLRPVRPTPSPSVAQDLYVGGHHYDHAQPGHCGPEPSGSPNIYVVELYFTDQANVRIDVRPYTGPGSYGPTPPAAITDPTSTAWIHYYRPPTIGVDTESQSRWDGPAIVRIDQSQRS
ncbi:MAG TPA: hypothetical protein VFR68_10505, partial [Candidatus Dormibacteraeota bacterium]|nr:hypothetical protein [Candidatus Dormibacteraeota bacterium]